MTLMRFMKGSSQSLLTFSAKRLEDGRNNVDIRRAQTKNQ
jgi:hypothetical protein